MVPEMATAELKRLQPQMEKLKKEVQMEVLDSRGEIKKEMEKMQKDLLKQQEELKIEMKQWVRDADI
jgi:hypothetical protein